MPLRDHGCTGGRPPRFRIVRARRRVALRRRRNNRTAAEPANDQLQGILSVIANEVQSRAALMSAGMQAQIAARINDALAIAPKEQHAGIMQALQLELSAALAAIAENAATELRGRQQAAIMANAGKGASPEDGELIEEDIGTAPGRPGGAVHRPERVLKR